ncbi:MAG: sulfatase [Opitutaceae bacterium]|nr:sulfatase [Opitutaceae bacterium]
MSRNFKKLSAAVALIAIVLSPLTRAADSIARPPARPNILWLIGEDLSPDLGCYGATQVWTPNLDRLAAEGMRFTRAFTTAPVCSASRSAFMTGMYQTTIGAHQHRSHRDDGYALPAGVRVLTDWLRAAGYFTANIRSLPAPVDFAGSGKTDWNFSYKGKPFDADQWTDLKSRQPFYAQVNFQETHREYSAMLAKHRAFSAPVRADPAKIVLPPYYPDHPEARADWANYLDSASELDRKIGEVLAQLERDGLADNTVVIFMGDHGGANVRGKQWCYESGLRIPLLIRWPKGLPAPAGFAAGTVSDRIIEAIDLSATTLALAGAPVPPAMQGRAFLGDRAAPPREFAFGARDRCDETVDRIRTVRDARYRYIRNFMPERPFLQPNKYKETMYPMIALMKRLHVEGKLDPIQEVLLAPHRPAEELYDLETDPHEIHNLAASPSPEHQAIRRRLSATLEKWIEDSADQGRTPESPEVIAYWEKQMQTVYTGTPAKK